MVTGQGCKRFSATAPPPAKRQARLDHGQSLGRRTKPARKRIAFDVAQDGQNALALGNRKRLEAILIEMAAASSG
jgi:hypothetical protein